MYFLFIEGLSYYIFTNSNFGHDLDTRQSATRIVHKLGSSIVDWSSKLQSTVILSTTEVEYCALSEAAKNVCCLCMLLNELHLCDESPTQLHNNNQSCIKLVDILVLYIQLKHIKIQHHFIRKKQQVKDSIITYVLSKVTYWLLN